MQNFEYKPILKNIDKCGDIKLSHGLIMDKKNKTERDGSTGISTYKFGKYWYFVGGNKVIFKSFDSMQGTRLNRIVNELLYYEIAKQVGLKCAKCELASMKGINGIISYSVLQNNEELLTAYKIKNISGYYNNDSNSIKIYYDALKYLSKHDYKIDVNKETLKLYHLCLIDELLLHTDRHSGNINFIQNTKINEIRLAPIFDNEFAFCCFGLDKTVQDYNIINFSVVKSLYNNSGNLLSVRELKDDTPKYNQIKNDLVAFASKNKEAEKILAYTLKNIDIQTAIKNVEEKGVIIPDDYKDYITMIVCESVKCFEQTIEVLKNLNKNGDRNVREQ